MGNVPNISNNYYSRPVPGSFKAEEITEHIIDKGNCSRTLLLQQGERLLASVAGSSVPSVLNLNCQRAFKKPVVVSTRRCVQSAANGKNG